MILNNSSSSKGVNWLDYAKDSYTFNDADFTSCPYKTIRMSGFENITSFSRFFYSTEFNANTRLVLVIQSNTDILSFNEMFSGAAVNEVIIYLKDTHVVNNITSFVRASSVKVVRIIGGKVCPTSASSIGHSGRTEILDFIIDCSNTTSFNLSSTTTAFGFKEIRLKPNTLSVDMITGTSTTLSVASLISLANGLKDNVTPKQYFTRQKSTLNSVVGNVEQHTDEDGNTYNFFVEADDGEYTLTEFITDLKGWTVT